MGLLDVILGRTKPVRPDLDQLFALPSAAITLQAGAGLVPTGRGSVCFAGAEGGGFTRLREEMQGLLTASDTDGTSGVEFRTDGYGYTWLLLERPPDDVASLVNDLHAVNTVLEDGGFGPQLLCSLVGFEDAEHRPLALVYLYKRGTFYPLSTRPDLRKRDSALELQVAALLKNDLRIEPDLNRWFPIYDAPGME